MIARDTNVHAIQKIEKRNSDSPKHANSLSLKLNQLMSHPAVVASLMQTAEMQASSGVFVKVDYRYKKLMNEDIRFIEALSDYVNVYTNEKRYTVHSTLYHILEKLPYTDFIRVHRSYIIRIDRVTAIEDHHLYIDDTQIPIGKTFRDELMSRLNVFY